MSYKGIVHGIDLQEAMKFMFPKALGKGELDTLFAHGVTPPRIRESGLHEAVRFTGEVILLPGENDPKLLIRTNEGDVSGLRFCLLSSRKEHGSRVYEIYQLDTPVVGYLFDELDSRKVSE